MDAQYYAQNSKQSRKRNIPRCLPLAVRVANDTIDTQMFSYLRIINRAYERPLWRDGLCIKHA